MQVPVRVGEEYDVEVLALGSKGDGYAKVGNFAVFIAGTEVGMTYHVRIKKVIQKCAFADVVA